MSAKPHLYKHPNVFILVLHFVEPDFFLILQHYSWVIQLNILLHILDSNVS